MMIKTLSLYLVFTCFNPDMVSGFPLLLHAWTDLKSIFLDFLCSKVIPFTNKSFMASSIFWCCLAIIGGQGYPLDGLVVIWDTSDCLDLFDGYLESV